MHNNDLVGSARRDAMDRLSSLPDHIIHKILSFISIKDAIGTSILSSRWRSIWTSTHCLNFENLNHGPHVFEFISNVLSHRNNQIKVSTVNLVLERTVRDDESVRIILNYTFSHNVQQLSVTRSPGNILECPYSFIASPRWDLPALTTLHLHHVKLSDSTSFFSKCTNLKNLFLRRCSMKGTEVLDICHPRLSNLTLQYTELEEVVNVVAPQLNNLTIKWCEGKHLINAPGLTSLVIEGFQPWRLSTPAGFHFLETVDLLMYEPINADAYEILCLLQQFRSVKLLILNFGILECLFSQRKSLSSSMERIPHKACAFPNAKILKFITKSPLKVYLEVGAQGKVTTCTEKTPSAIFPMVSCEEIIAIGDMASAHIFVRQFRLMVEQCQADTNRDKVHMDEPEVEMHWAWELGWNLGELMALIRYRKIVALETCLMMTQIKQKYDGRLRTRPIMEWLQEMRALFERIGRLITEQLSASKRAVMLPIFLSLCEDAAVLTVYMLRWIRTNLRNAVIV